MNETKDVTSDDDIKPTEFKKLKLTLRIALALFCFILSTKFLIAEFMLPDYFVSSGGGSTVFIAMVINLLALSVAIWPLGWFLDFLRAFLALFFLFIFSTLIRESEFPLNKLFNIPLSETYSQEKLKEWASPFDALVFKEVGVVQGKEGKIVHLRLLPKALTDLTKLSIEQELDVSDINVEVDSNNVIKKVTWILPITSNGHTTRIRSLRKVLKHLGGIDSGSDIFDDEYYWDGTNALYYERDLEPSLSILKAENTDDVANEKRQFIKQSKAKINKMVGN